MVSAIKFILKNQLKYPRQTHKTSGFTLIELLVAMILAVLVITPLLGFMIDILSTDRKEQAKANSEQEIQTAVDYIGHDLEQAVYIYDGDGLKIIQNQLPQATDIIKNPYTGTATPVLVFWKRTSVVNAISLSNKACPDAANAIKSTNCNDSFVYSIVAYYLLTTDNDPNWSTTAARIGRVEIKDGIRDPVNPLQNDNITPNYITYPSGDTRNRDAGFQIFDLNSISGTLENKMNNWKSKSGQGFPNTLTLADYIYIDKTGKQNTPSQVDCQSALGVPATDTTRPKTKLTTSGPNSSNTNPYTGFYACVDVKTNTAQIYVNGNALARIQQSTTYSPNSPYFPSATIKIQGRGFLYTQ